MGGAPTATLRGTLEPWQQHGSVPTARSQPESAFLLPEATFPVDSN